MRKFQIIKTCRGITVIQLREVLGDPVGNMQHDWIGNSLYRMS